MARETLISIIESSQRLHNQLSSGLDFVILDGTGQYRSFCKIALDIAPTTPSARSFKDVELLGSCYIDYNVKRLDHLSIYRLFSDTIAHVSNIGGTVCVRLLNTMDQAIALYYIGTTPEYSSQFLKNLGHIILSSRDIDSYENENTATSRNRKRVRLDFDAAIQ